MAVYLYWKFVVIFVFEIWKSNVFVVFDLAKWYLYLLLKHVFETNPGTDN